MMVWRLLSLWDGLFSGAMLNFQGVDVIHGNIFLAKQPGKWLQVITGDKTWSFDGRVMDIENFR